MDASDNAQLLESAVATNDTTDLFQWYKAVSKFSPYWTRQEDVYNETMGPQTTLLTRLPPWRVMSHLLEKETCPFKEKLTVARLALEVISDFDDDEHLLDRDTVLRLAEAHTDANRLKDEKRFRYVQKFFEAGAPNAGLSELRGKVLRVDIASSKSAALKAKAYKAIVDARAWLTVVKHCLEVPINGDAYKQWRIALPFLDAAEIEYVRTPEAHSNPRETSVWMIHRRLTSFPGALIDPAVIFGYAYNRNDAQKFRVKCKGPPRMANPIKGDPPAYRSDPA